MHQFFEKGEVYVFNNNDSITSSTFVYNGLKALMVFNFFSADWYKGRLTDEELAALENPPTPKPKPTGASRRKPSRPPLKTQA